VRIAVEPPPSRLGLRNQRGACGGIVARESLQPGVERGFEFGGKVGSGHFFSFMARESGASQYSVTAACDIGGAAYWIIRWSLSSGSPEARPGGG